MKDLVCSLLGDDPFTDFISEALGAHPGLVGFKVPCALGVVAGNGQADGTQPVKRRAAEGLMISIARSYQISLGLIHLRIQRPGRDCRFISAELGHLATY